MTELKRMLDNPPLIRELPPRAFLQAILVFAVLFTVYALTTSRTVGLEDDGLFILSSYNAGISHPPGYPLYAWLGKAFTLLPMESIAFKVHLSSAFMGALTGVMVWWCIALLTPGSAPALAGALTFGFSRIFWSQATTAEVYTLNSFFFFLLLALCLRLVGELRHEGSRGTEQRSAEGKTGLLLLTAFAAGLSLSNHWPLIVLSAPALLVLVWPQRLFILSRLHLVVPLFLLGLAPYAWMVFRSQSDPVASFYGPLSTWQEFWFMVSRKGYSGVDQSATAGLGDQAQFAAYFLRQVATQLTIGGFMLAAWGFLRQHSRWGTNLALCLVVGFLGSSFVLIALLGFDFDKLHVAVFRVYPLVAYGIMALWLGLGVSEASRLLHERVDNVVARRMLAPALSTALILATLAIGWRVNDRSGFTYAEDYASAVIDSLPEDAVIFLGDDVSFGSVAYLHLLLGKRPDIRIYNPEGLVLANRLFHPLRTEPEDMVAAIFDFIQETDRPVYFLHSRPLFENLEQLALFHRFDRTEGAGMTYTVDDRLFQHLERLLEVKRPGDDWLAVHQDILSEDFGRVLGAYPTADEARFRELLDRYPRLTRGNLSGQLGIALGMVSRPDRIYPATLLQLLQGIEPLLSAEGSKQQLGQYFFILGTYLITQGDYPSAETYLEQSAAIWPHSDNPASDQLASLRRQLGN